MGANQLNIRQLSNALSRETNELMKYDIQSDIFDLINRKKHLANKLNFNYNPLQYSAC